jgi:hypothetical protein
MPSCSALPSPPPAVLDIRPSGEYSRLIPLGGCARPLGPLLHSPRYSWSRAIRCSSVLLCCHVQDVSRKLDVFSHHITTYYCGEDVFSPQSAIRNSHLATCRPLGIASYGSLRDQAVPVTPAAACQVRTIHTLQMVVGEAPHFHSSAAQMAGWLLWW